MKKFLILLGCLLGLSLVGVAQSSYYATTLDTGGHPLSNGIVKVYTAGSCATSCIPTTIYFDWAQTMPVNQSTNPIITDAGGNYHFFTSTSPVDIQITWRGVITTYDHVVLGQPSSGGTVTGSSLTNHAGVFGTGGFGIATDNAILTDGAGTLSATGFNGPLNGIVGGITPVAGTFSALTLSSITGVTEQCLHANTSGLVTGTGIDCGSGSGGGNVTGTGLTNNAVVLGSTGSAIKVDGSITSNGSGTLTAAGFSGPLNGTVGATSPSSGVFTTVTASGTVTGTPVISGSYYHSTASTPGLTGVPGQGVYIGWNRGGAGGETDFINNHGSFTGGFNWYDTPAAGTPVTSLMNVNASGVLSANGFTGPLNGTVGAISPTVGTFTTLTANGPIIGNAGIQNIGVNPDYIWRDNSAPLNAKVWDMYADTGGTLIGRTINDAFNAANFWLTVSRSGQTPTGAIFYEPVAVPSLNGVIQADRSCNTPGLLDQSCIQNAINSCPSTGLCAIHVPAGTYNIASTISWTSPKANLKVECDGQASILLAATAAVSILSIGDSSHSVGGVDWNGCFFSQTHGSPTGVGVTLLNPNFDHFDNFRISNFSQNLSLSGTGGANVCQDTHITNFLIEGATSIGILYNCAGGGVDINSGFVFQAPNVGYAIDILQAAGGDINNTGTLGGTYGLVISPGASQIVALMLFDSDVFDTGTAGAVAIAPGSNGDVHVLNFSNTYISNSGNGVSITGTASTNISDISFVGGEIIHNTNTGVVINAGGSTMKNIGIKNNQIIGNSLAGLNSFSGITINGSVSNWAITGNTCGNDAVGMGVANQAYCLSQTGSASDFYLFANNDCTTSNLGCISNASTAGHGQVYGNSGFTNTGNCSGQFKCGSVATGTITASSSVSVSVVWSPAFVDNAYIPTCTVADGGNALRVRTMNALAAGSTAVTVDNTDAGGSHSGTVYCQAMRP